MTATAVGIRTAAVALLAFAAAASTAAAQQPAAAPPPPPAGLYRVDPAHASVNFRISHLGLSNYTARFTRFTAELGFDPAHPAAQSVTAVIDARSLQTNYPEPQKLDFDGQIEKQFLDAEKYPQITFRSTRVDLTGPKSARITGDLTLHGVTRPVVLEATFNGGYGPTQFDPSGARVGFSAHGAFNRSDFGIDLGLPPPGTSFGVGDRIEVLIEAEFSKPAEG
jgi:polyisoprenoid-binding protein YceI